MSRSGTLLFCLHNLDCSGANQVVLNIIIGSIHCGNVVVLAPKTGSMAARFCACGVSVRIGDLNPLLTQIRDIFLIVCNTIMTADLVMMMHQCAHPVIWIIHEWWTDAMITENFSLRDIRGLTLSTVKYCLQHASHIVFVCEAQRQLYGPSAPSSVIYVGVPPCTTSNCDDDFKELAAKEFCSKVTGSDILDHSNQQTNIENGNSSYSDYGTTFLSVGIVCPRKNQLCAVKLFKEMAGTRTDLKFVIVGARVTRQYEKEYLDQVLEAIHDDHRIEVHGVTDDIAEFYKRSDVLLCTSVNEVTPVSFCEAMSFGIPVVTAEVGGISEMITHEVDGYLGKSDNIHAMVNYLQKLSTDKQLLAAMGASAKRKYDSLFRVGTMVDAYSNLMFRLAPPVVLVDMDGVVVDWDAGFESAWNNRFGSTIARHTSYYMEDCIMPQEGSSISLALVRQEACNLYHKESFFESLPCIPGAIDALLEMKNMGIDVFLCTSPISTSKYCRQEKVNWVRKHLGETWVDKIILTANKCVVRADVLIDDKPFSDLDPFGSHTLASWIHVVFTALYNRHYAADHRLDSWKSWRKLIYPLLSLAEGGHISHGNNFDVQLPFSVPKAMDIKKNVAMHNCSSSDNMC